MEALSNHGRDIIKALNVNVYGNGTQTVVLAHGHDSDQTVWHYLIPYIAFYFKVVVFDLVIARNVNPMLYDPKSTIYVGHSMFALIGCIAATKRPKLFKNHILLGGSPRMNYFQGGETYFLLVMTLVHFGHRTSIPQNVSPCNSDYKDLCIDVCLCVLD
ncbi:hypothetical protein UlMin_005294 [Ulmus minor]